MKKRFGTGFLEAVFPLLAAGILFLFLIAFSNLESGRREEGKEQLFRALQRCVVSCYATEGIYPPNVEYMKEHYGIQIDEERYTVIYEVFAENLMPEITVLEKEYEK